MKKLLGLICILALTSCASINVMNTPGKSIAAYKTAYVQMLPVDEFNLATAIIQEMSVMDFQVVAQPVPTNPSPTDIKVEYSYLTGWNMVKFLQSFRIIFSDAQTGTVISTLSYNTPGAFNGSRKYNEQARIHESFDEFRGSLKAQ